MNLLTGDQLLAADDVKRERVSVPEWGGDVIVQGLTGTERDAWEAEMVERGKEDPKAWAENVRARLLVRCLVNDQGERLFKADQAEALGKKNGAALAQVFDVAQRLSGLRKADVESVAKNSASGPSAASGSTSPTATASPSGSSSAA